MSASTPESRFTVNNDETVTDSVTGLTWRQCVEGMSGTNCSTGSASKFTWQEALIHAESQTSWRLPNIKELISLIERRCQNPAIALSIFPATPENPESFFWSSSLSAANTAKAWSIDFASGFNGNLGLRTNSFYVRLVKGGGTSNTVALVAPENLVAVAGNGQVSLTWDGVSAASSYQLVDEAGQVLVATVTESTYVFTGLTNNQSYTFRVASRDAAGKLSAYSPVVTAMPQLNPDPIDEYSYKEPLKLTDTGIIWGGNYPDMNNTTCIGETITEQDCSHGQDFADNDGSDGHAGFSFTKIASDGSILPASANVWACVRDNVTNFMWEVKQGGNNIVGDEGLHDTDDRYNSYDTNTITNGGYSGYEDNNGATCHAYQANNPASYCNTEAFVNRVNKASLCGYSDWSMPTPEALRSIVDYSRFKPSIDIDYFPATKLNWYWSSSPDASKPYLTRYVDFNYGNDGNYNHYNDLYVRLVRGGK